MDAKAVITQLHADTDYNIMRFHQLWEECHHFIFSTWEWYMDIELAQINHMLIIPAGFGLQPAGQYVLRGAV